MILAIIIILGIFFAVCFISVFWMLGQEMAEYKKEHALYMAERRRALEIRYPETNVTGSTVKGLGEKRGN